MKKMNRNRQQKSNHKREASPKKKPLQPLKHHGEKLPIESGNKYELMITGFGTGGEGVGRINDFTVFVPQALPGERVSVCIEDIRKNYARGSLLHIIEKSPDRAEPACSLFADCGGCQLQHLSYEAQLAAKRQQVLDALKHIGGIGDVCVLPTLGAENPWHYRNKMQFPVGREKGNPVIGCFAQGTHRIIDTEDCLIQKAANNALVQAMREAVKKFHIPIYDEDRHTGILRHVTGRVAKNGDTMAVLVTARKELRHAKEIAAFLRSHLPRVVSIQQNIQTYHNNVILGRETKLLWGSQTILDSVGSLSFHISARSFFQVNTEQAEVLYKKALEAAQLTGKETVIDAYCGTGTISLFFAQRAKKVYGIEIVRPAILDARQNAKDNGIKNAEFIVGDAARIMPHLYNKGIRPHVIVVDPPRAGCTQTVLQTFVAMQPQRIVYVSCNPATLARDLALLKEMGYQAEEVQPVDMFPMTAHIESVARIEKICK